MDSRDQPSSSDRPADDTATPKSSAYGRLGLFGRIEGDSAQRHNQEDEEDRDSDEESREPFNHKPDPQILGRQISEKRKGKQASSRRRFTIEPGQAQDEVILTDVTEDEANSIHAIINTSEDFVSSATRSPEEWREGLKYMLENVRVCRDNLGVLDQQNRDLSKELTESKAKSRALAGQLRDANARAIKEERTSARIRRLRDKYRQESEDLRLENTQLKVAAAAAQQANPQDADDLEDSDVEVRREQVRSRQPSTHAPLSNLRGNQRFTPGATTDRTESAGTNKRYPDVPDFYGTKDRDKWEGWRLHLYAKFRQSSTLFPTESDKIDYVRDHCKETAFDVIKTRSDPFHQNPYVTAEEMVEELDAMFGTYDKVAKSDALLHDPSFGMGIVDKKETFETFYARFSAAIAPLDLPDTYKMSNLKRTISTRLRYRISGENFPAFRDMVARLRHVAADLEAIDKTAPPREKSGTGNARGGSTGTSSTQRNNNAPTSGTSAYKGRGYKYPSHLIDRIKKEGRCWKCLKPGHRSGDSDAPCKNSDPLNKDQVEVVMKTAGVEPENPAPTELPSPSTGSEN